MVNVSPLVGHARVGARPRDIPTGQESSPGRPKHELDGPIKPLGSRGERTVEQRTLQLLVGLLLLGSSCASGTSGSDSLAGIPEICGSAGALLRSVTERVVTPDGAAAIKSLMRRNLPEVEHVAVQQAARNFLDATTSEDAARFLLQLNSACDDALGR